MHHSPHECKGISLEYLKAVAQVRFGLHLAATCLIQEAGCNEPMCILGQDNNIKDSAARLRLLAVIERICTDTTINQIDQVHATGPLMYLLRLLVRRYGMMPLRNVCKKYQWVQPPNLELTTEVSRNSESNYMLCYTMHYALQNKEIIDEFVIYGDKYTQIQEQVSKTIYGGMVQQLAIVPKVQY